MGHTAGADVPATIRALREAGRYSPSAANFTALVELVDARYGQAIHGHALASAVHLKAAAEALKTDADRSEREAIAERLRADAAEHQRRDEAERAQRNAEMTQLRDSVRIAQRQPRRSVIYDLADPFDAIDKPAEPAMPF